MARRNLKVQSAHKLQRRGPFASVPDPQSSSAISGGSVFDSQVMARNDSRQAAKNVILGSQVKTQSTNDSRQAAKNVILGSQVKTQSTAHLLALRES